MSSDITLRLSYGFAGQWSGGVGEAVGVGSGLDDRAVEHEAVDDRGAETRVGERLGPVGERLIGRDRHRCLLLALSEHLEEQFGAAAVELHVSELGLLPISGEAARDHGFLLGSDHQIPHSRSGVS